LARALAHLTYARRFLVEARDHYAAAIRLAPDHHDAVDALREAANAAVAQFEGEAAFGHLTAASERALDAGDRARAAVILADAAMLAERAAATFDRRRTPEELAALIAKVEAFAPPEDREVAAHLAMAMAFADYSETCATKEDRADEALRFARGLDDPVLISQALDAVSAAATSAGHHKAAARLTTERMDLLDRLPRHDPRAGGEVVDIYHTATEAALGAGELGT